MERMNLAKYICVIFMAAFVLYGSKTSANSDALAVDAQKFVENISNKALKVITNKKLSDMDKEERLVNIFERSVDTKWVAKFVTGRYWREFSDEQKKEYLKSYKDFLISSYIPKFKEYTNQKILFDKSTKEDTNDYLVETRITQVNQPSIKVSYKVKRGDDGKFIVYDIIAEGVSLITTQRSEFTSILSRKNIDYLIEKLKSKLS